MSAIQPQTIPLITNASMSNATAWLLTAAGLFIDTQTITIGGVVLTTNTLLGGAGSVLLGANQAATLANITAALNAPTVATATYNPVSAADAYTLTTILGITATTTATVMTMVSSNKSPIVVSETQTNVAWSSVYTSRGFGVIARGMYTLQFVASAISSGNGVFTVEASNDGINWTAYNRLTTNVANTNVQTDTRVANVTLNANSSAIVTLPDPFAFYRVIATITTDGLYSVTSCAV